MALVTITNSSISNSETSDVTKLTANDNDLVNGITDGTKDIWTRAAGFGVTPTYRVDISGSLSGRSINATSSDTTASSYLFYGVKTGAATTNYGLYLDVSGATTNWALYASAGASYFGASVYLNDTTNANNTLGLTINQGANDNEILSLKSSDVAHGITDETETDTYGLFKKWDSDSGGLFIEGLTEGAIALALIASATSDITTKTTSSDGAIRMKAAKKSGTSTGNMGADANLLVLINNATTRFILDAEGSGHADVEWTTYDKHDDLNLIAQMEQELLAREDEAKTERRHYLESAGVIGKGSWHMEKDRPRAMVNFTKLSMLHHGALIQVADRFSKMEEKMELMGKKLAVLGA